MSIALEGTDRLSQLKDRMKRSQEAGFDYEKRATVEVPACNVCRTNKTLPIAHRDRYGFAVGCIECKNCQCAWLSPRMPASDYQDFYSNWYRPILSAWYGREFTPESIENDQTFYAKAVADALLKHLAGRDGQSLLDVGGSTGITALALADVYGVVPTVLDPCDAELERAKQRGFRTIHGCAETAPVWEKFDVITMMQTIEHLTDPRGTVSKLKCLLKPNGLLIFDCNQWQQQKTSRPVEMFIKIDHLYYFSDYSILWLLESVGLELVTKFCCVNNKWHYVCRAGEIGRGREADHMRVRPGEIF